MVLKWDDRIYATGCPVIDAQHKSLFKMVNRLLAAMKAGRGNEEIADMIRFLDSYIDKHFSYEEAEMERRRCKACSANKKAHRAFRLRFENLKNKFDRDGASLALVVELQRTVCRWLQEHIARIDTKLRDCR